MPIPQHPRRHLTMPIHFVALVAAALCGLVASVQAQTIVDWTNPFGGSFTAGANWATDSLPGSSDSTRFALNATYTVNFIGSPTNEALFVNEGNVTFAPLGVFNAARTYVVDFAEIDGGSLAIASSGADTLELQVPFGELAVGVNGTGSLTIEAGGRVSNGDGIIGQNTGSTGLVTVGDPGSNWTLTGDLNIADAGTGTLTIRQGGSVDVTANAQQHAGGQIVLDDGTLSARSLSVRGGSLTGTGRVEATGTSAIEVMRNASLSPGNSTGLLTLIGDLELDGTLTTEVVSTTDFDILDVQGDIQFGAVSRLEFLLADDFIPVDGLQLTFLTAESVDLFSSVTVDVAGLDSRFIAEVRHDLSTSDLSLNFSLNGDFDSDGDIDGADFLLWQRGGSPNSLRADDLAAWRTNFGAGMSLPSIHPTTVPEPAPFVFLLIGALIGLIVGNRMRSQTTNRK